MIESGDVTRATPMGCVIMLSAVIPLIFAGLCGWAIYKVRVEVESGYPQGMLLIWGLGLAFNIILAAFLVRGGYRSLKAQNWKDYDPDKPPYG